MDTQPVAVVTDSDVTRIVHRDFPADQVGEVQTILATYGAESWHPEPQRVRCAALKLADGDLDALRAQIVAACTDFRDVLAAAEYPIYWQRDMEGTLVTDADEREAFAADWRQYQEWLTRPERA